MIELKNISFHYRKNEPIFKDYSLKISKGDRIALMGVSGSGKTTLLRLICGLETPKSGRRIADSDIRFSVVFQENRLIPHKNTLQNVTLFSNEESARAMLEKLGLSDFTQSLPDELSGGQKRRVAIARALCRDFDVLVLDEPFTGLDNELKTSVIEVINSEIKDKTLILVTHDVEDAVALNTKII